MSRMFQFKKKYFIIAVLLFITEVVIAIYFKKGFIRAYFGDFLVVILIYFFVRTFLDISPFKCALGTLIFSFSVEFAQYFNVVKILGLEGNRLAEIIIGTHFSVPDLVSYLLGVLVAFYVDGFLVKKEKDE